MVAATIAVLALSACDFPRDADGTHDRVLRDGRLHVGVVEHPPWVVMRNGMPSGIEPALVAAFASSLGVRVVWVAESESNLIAALRERELDLVVGGFDASSPWASEASPTQPYLETSIVVARPADRPIPDDISGRHIAYEPGRPDIEALIVAKDARPVAAANLHGKVSAVYRFEAVSANLVPTKTVLVERRLVMLVAPGESRMLLALDRFLAGDGRVDLAIASNP